MTENLVQIEMIILELLLLGALIYTNFYLRDKAKNLATKEDVGEITEIVETIKKENARELAAIAQQYQLELKQIEQINDLRLAALDERLKAYQEAYALVFRMLDALGNREASIDVMQEANAFWINRSLYISEEVREAINNAILAVSVHDSTLKDSTAITPRENRQRISHALRAIERAVNLPGFHSAAERNEEIES